jgi:hypothetical protein
MPTACNGLSPAPYLLTFGQRLRSPVPGATLIFPKPIPTAAADFAAARQERIDERPCWHARALNACAY